MKAREKWLIKARREIEEHEYHHEREEAHKLIRNKEKLYIKNVIESVEEDRNYNYARKMCQTINQFKKGLLYPARSRWGTYRGYCSRRDGARTSVKTGSWEGRTHSQ